MLMHIPLVAEPLLSSLRVYDAVHICLCIVPVRMYDEVQVY